MDANPGESEVQDSKLPPTVVARLTDLGAVGLSVSTILIAYLYFLGIAYWSGFLSRFGLGLWVVRPNYLQLIVPDFSTISFLGAVLFMLFVWHTSIGRAARAALLERRLDALRHRIDSGNACSPETAAGIRDLERDLGSLVSDLPSKWPRWANVATYVVAISIFIGISVWFARPMVEGALGPITGLAIGYAWTKRQSREARALQLVALAVVPLAFSLLMGMRDATEWKPKRIDILRKTSASSVPIGYHLIICTDDGYYVAPREVAPGGRAATGAAIYIPKDEVAQIEFGS